MDWINELTRGWKLNKSFMFYLFIGLLVSLPSGIILQSVSGNFLKTIILKRSVFTYFTFLDRVIYSNFIRIFIEIIPYLVIFIITSYFFRLFFNHKIQPVKSYIHNPSLYVITNDDDLSSSIIQLGEKIEEFEMENFMNINYINEVNKKTSSISHEIKNPLAVIKGDTELLDEIFSKKSPGINSIVDRIKRSERRIEDILNNLIKKDTLRNIKPDIKELSVIELSELIKEITLNEVVRKKAVFTNKTCEINGSVMVDVNFFLEGISNILWNAKTYSENEVKVTLYIEKNMLVTEIKDDGKGFSREALLNCTKAYFSENKEEGSMGLGLYITEKLLSVQGIKMEILNDNGGVVKIFIRLT